MIEIHGYASTSTPLLALREALLTRGKGQIPASMLDVRMMNVAKESAKTVL